MPNDKLSAITMNKGFKFFSDHGAELNYIVGTFLNDMTNRVKKNDTLIQLNETSRVSVVVGWNYLDGFYNFMQAFKLYADKDNYHYHESLFKASINLFSGIQLYTFSYNPALTDALKLRDPSSFAGVSFFVAMVVDLISASLDFKHMHRETTFEGWLDEKLHVYYDGFKKARDVDELGRDIRARCKAFVAHYPDRKKSLKFFIKSRMPADIEQHGCSLLLKNLSCEEAKHKLRDHELALEINLRNRHYRTQLLIKAASAIGMGCLAIAGFYSDTNSDAYIMAMVIGLALTNVVASWYTIKNSERLADSVGHRFDFFSSRPCLGSTAEDNQYRLG